MPLAPGASPFDAMRRRAQQQGAAAGEQAQDQVRRQFAANGMAGSGANIRTARLVNDQTNRATQDAVAGVDSQEAQLQGQQDFAREERLGSEKFQQGMFDQDLGFKKQQESNADYWRGIDAQQSEAANSMNFMLGLGNLDWNPRDVGNLYQMSSAINRGYQSNGNPTMAAIQRRLGGR